MSWEPTILVTNDDGITAPGIKNLIDAVRHLGKVIVVAPDSPQSGMGHAVSIEKPLRLNKVDIFRTANTIRRNLTSTFRFLVISIHP